MEKLGLQRKCHLLAFSQCREHQVGEGYIIKFLSHLGDTDLFCQELKIITQALISPHSLKSWKIISSFVYICFKRRESPIWILSMTSHTFFNQFPTWLPCTFPMWICKKVLLKINIHCCTLSIPYLFNCRTLHLFKLIPS